MKRKKGRGRPPKPIFERIGEVVSFKLDLPTYLAFKLKCAEEEVEPAEKLRELVLKYCLRGE